MQEEDKSSEKSNEFRKIGNDSFQNNQFYDALKSYNKSLCYAKSSEDASLAYGNRSAVYFELKLYQHCLDNIGLALPDYPKDKTAKLIERQEKCRKIILENESLELPFYKEIKDMIKLTYPANPKIPYIADCLEMKTDAVFGRGIYATRDLNPGDIVAIEDIRVNYILYANYERCCICMKTNNLDLQSANDKTTLMVCSTECKTKQDILQKFNERPGFSINKINLDLDLPEKSHYDAIKDNKRKLKTIFDYDWSNLTGDQYKLAYLKCFYGLYSFREQDKALHYSKNMMNILLGSRLEFGYTNVRNDGEMTAYQFECFLPFGSLLNHSCEPNIFYFEFDRSMVFYVARPIKKEEQLFMSYFGGSFLMHDRDIRILELEQKYNFICQCKACSLDYEDYFTDDEYADPKNIKEMSIEEAIQELKKNNEKLKNHSGNVSDLLLRNNELINLIFSTLVLPFKF